MPKAQKNDKDAPAPKETSLSSRKPKATKEKNKPEEVPAPPPVTDAGKQHGVPLSTQPEQSKLVSLENILIDVVCLH